MPSASTTPAPRLTIARWLVAGADDALDGLVTDDLDRLRRWMWMACDGRLAPVSPNENTGWAVSCVAI